MRTVRPARSPRMLLSIAAVALALVMAPADAASAHPPRFLTLPFASVNGMRIQDGWWRWSHDLHAGIDYIKGVVDRSDTWQTFPVIAAVGGRACAARSGHPGCIDGVGTRVVVRSRIGGKVYSTYYGHLASVSSRIPMGVRGYTVKVRRGQFLGWAGHSGDAPGVTHLHFQVVLPTYASLDPYDLYAYRGAYPDPPGTNGHGCGPDRLWIACPPLPPRQATTASLDLPTEQPATIGPRPIES